MTAVCSQGAYLNFGLLTTPNTGWSAPSAIGTGGIGFGSQAGAEVTDFLVVLNTRAVSSHSTISVLRWFLITGTHARLS